MTQPVRMVNVVGIHLLGAGDLGVRPEAYAGALERLLAADDDLKPQLLLTTRSEGFHARPPLSAFLADAAPPPPTIWLVATEQERAAAGSGDTRRLADEIEAVLRRRQDLYGRPFVVRKLVVREMSIDAFRRTLRDEVAAAPPDELLVYLGTGPTVGYVGTVFGCVEAGVRPKVVQRSLPGVTVDLDVTPRLKRWLARMCAYGLLAAHDPDHPDEWRMLAAMHRLDWTAARAAGREQAGSIPESAGARAPATASEHEFYRKAIESSLLDRVGRGDRLGAFLLRPWIHARYAELHFAKGAPGEPAAELEAVVQRQRREGWESEFLLPLRKLWGIGRKADHGKLAAVEKVDRELRRAIDRVQSNGSVRGIERLGYPAWPSLPGVERLVVLTVGRQNVRDDGTSPMLEAILDDDPAAILRLRLVCTEDTADQARRLATMARGQGESVEPLDPVPVADPVATYEIVRRALSGDATLLQAGSAAAIVGPGTKPMNVGAVLGVLAWSMENAVPMHLGALLKRDSGSRSELEWSAGAVAARLAHDRVVRSVLLIALDELGLGLALRLCELGSARWDGMKERLESLETLLFGRSRTNIRRLLDEQVPNFASLWPARLALLAQVIDTDPWRAIYAAAAIGEATWPPGGPSQGGAGRWADSGRFPASHRLWRWRVESPFGHAPWRVPPAAGTIRSCFAHASHEHTTASSLSPDTLVDRWRALRAEVRSMPV